MSDKYRISTTNIQNDIYDFIEKVVNSGVYINKSEFIREAVRIFVEKEKKIEIKIRKLNEELEKLNDK